MPTLAAVLKTEIRKLAARENRRFSSQLRGLRQRLKGLKAALRAQKLLVTRLERRLARVARPGPVGAPAEPRVDGRRVAALRGRLQMSRLEFARLLGVSPGSIFGWEKGRTQPRGHQRRARPGPGAAHARGTAARPQPAPAPPPRALDRGRKMVELLHRERTIKVKIIYYGPPVGGKTTNLQVLHQHALAARKGEMISVNSAQDRTILFDLLPLRTTGFRGYDVRLQVLAVPGQGMYAATRRLVLKGSDALVFVANSAADRWEENIQSFREMTQNLLAHQLEPASIPLVLQYNKRDLPDITPFEFMDRALNARKVDAIPAVAVRGEGVLETFSSILMRTLQDLASRYQIVDPGRGQNLAQWTQNAVQGMFGTTSLALEPNPVGPAEPPPGFTVDLPDERPTRRTVRVALPEDAVRMARRAPTRAPTRPWWSPTPRPRSSWAWPWRTCARSATWPASAWPTSRPSWPRPRRCSTGSRSWPCCAAC